MAKRLVHAVVIGSEEIAEVYLDRKIPDPPGVLLVPQNYNPKLNHSPPSLLARDARTDKLHFLSYDSSRGYEWKLGS